MREFLRFIRHFYEMAYLCRGVFVALAILILVFSLMLMRTEGWSFGSALYAAAITALTVGYGDITPKSTPGRLLSVLVAFIGLIWTGMVVAIATRALANTVEDERARSVRPPHKETGQEHGGRPR